MANAALTVGSITLEQAKLISADFVEKGYVVDQFQARAALKRGDLVLAKDSDNKGYVIGRVTMTQYLNSDFEKVRISDNRYTWRPFSYFVIPKGFTFDKPTKAKKADTVVAPKSIGPVKGDRVMAKYAEDGMYYAATLVKKAKVGYVVRWEDGDYEETSSYVFPAEAVTYLKKIRPGVVFQAYGDRLVTYEVGAEVKPNPYNPAKGYTFSPKRGTKRFIVTAVEGKQPDFRCDVAADFIGMSGGTWNIDLAHVA